MIRVVPANRFAPAQAAPGLRIVVERLRIRQRRQQTGRILKPAAGWIRSRQVGSSVAGPFDEIWHPAAHRARFEIEVQDERRIAIPSPGDPLNLGTANPHLKPGAA